MQIILPGVQSRHKKRDILGGIIGFCLTTLPGILVIGAAIMFVIQLVRAATNTRGFIEFLLAVFLVPGDRSFWLWGNGATIVSVFQNSAVEYTYRFLAAAIVLGLGSYVLNKRCPYCGHFFTMRRISDNKFEGSTSRSVSNTYNDYSDALAVDLSGNMYYAGITTKKKQYGTKITEIYSYNLRCSCCGCVAKTSAAATHTHWE